MSLESLQKFQGQTKTLAQADEWSYSQLLRVKFVKQRFFLLETGRPVVDGGLGSKTDFVRLHPPGKDRVCLLNDQLENILHDGLAMKMFSQAAVMSG